MNSMNIHDKPYEYICEFAEALYPKIGRKTFEVISLMPCSLIIPDLSFDSKKIRSNIHALFLASSGAGKTSIAKLFANITYSPLEFESITAARMESAIVQNPVFSLIVGDFARMSRDPILIKVIEGLLGEEKSVSRKTMRKDIDMEAEGTSLLCGVSNDLSSYIMSGLIFRVVPIMVSHSHEEHSYIGKHIMDKIGTSSGNGDEQTIKDYYQELLQIQNKSHKINQIVGYSIKKEFKDKLYEKWEVLTSTMVRDLGLNFFRELQEGVRFLIASAFLNIFNRENKNGILVPNEEDFDIAMRLMRRAIIFKSRLIWSEGFAKGIKNAKDFREIMQSDKISESSKEFLRNLVQIKGDRVSLKK